MAFETFTPMEYLKIDIANNYAGSLDKELFSTRIAWFNAHEHELDELVDTAENPALFFAGVQAYRKAEKGESIGYPVSLDGVASGMQMFACLTGCEDTAKLCGLVDTGRREDPYTSIYKQMQKFLGSTATIERKDTKNAIMTSMGSMAE